MTTFNTGNPLGSSDPRDLYDNAENFDDALNGPDNTWIDRRGVTRTSWKGIEVNSAAGSYTFTSLPELQAITPPAGTSPAGRVTEGPDAGYYVYKNGAWVETDDPLKGNGNDINPVFVPYSRNGEISPPPKEFMAFAKSITVHGALEGKDYQLWYFQNQSNDFLPPADALQITQYDAGTWDNPVVVLQRIPPIVIDRTLDKQAIHVESNVVPGLSFSLILSPSSLPPIGTRLRAGVPTDPGYSWKISPTCYQPNLEEIKSDIVDLQDRIGTNYSSEFTRLIEALIDPLHGVRVKHIGDSITWGSGADNIAPTEPRAHQLSDVRNNYTSRTYVNIFRDYLGKTFLPNAVLFQEDTAYHQAPAFSGYAYYTAPVLVDLTADNSVQFVSRTTGKALNKSTLTRIENRTSAVYKYTIPLSSVRNENAFIKFPHTGDSITVVFTWAGAETHSTGVAKLFDDDTGAELGSFQYADGVSANAKRFKFTFPWGKRNLRLENMDTGGTWNFEIEALEHDKKICVNNDGLSGTVSAEWQVDKLGGQSIDANDEFVFVQLGANDRGITPDSAFATSFDSGKKQYENNMQGIIDLVLSRTGHTPILMCSNATFSPSADPAVNGFSMAEVNGILKKLAYKNKTSFIDNFIVTSDLKIAGIPYSYDGLHPNDLGYSVIANNMVNEIFDSAVSCKEIAEWRVNVIAKYGLVPELLVNTRKPLTAVRYTRTTVDGRMRFTPVAGQATAGYASIDLSAAKIDPRGKVIRYRIRLVSGTGVRQYVVAASGDIDNANNFYGVGSIASDETKWTTYEVDISKRGNGTEWSAGELVDQILIPFFTPTSNSAVIEIEWLVVGTPATPTNLLVTV